MKLKIFYTTKEMVSKLKRPHTECEKYLLDKVQRTSDKGLITRIYKELKKTKLPLSQ
jgi:hypothetical protein